MNAVALQDAIRTRLVQSFAAESVDVQGVWYTVAPEIDGDGDKIEIVKGCDPIVMFSLTNGSPLGVTDDPGVSGFAVDAFEGSYTVEVMTHRYPASGLATLSTAWETVVGDGTASSAPTYGLHRWRPTVSGYSVSTMGLERFGSEVRGDQGEIVVAYGDFRVLVEKD